MTPPHSTDGREHIPAIPTLVIPNRMDLPSLRVLEEALGGSNRVAWMVENTLRPEPEVMMYLSQTHAAGFLCSLEQSAQEDLVQQVRHRMAQGRFVVLLCGHPGRQAATLADVPGKLLCFADNSNLSALPVFVGMYNNSLTNGIVNAAPYDTLRVSFMPVVPPGSALGANVRAAWMAAEAAQLASHPVLQSDLPELLHEALNNHPAALMIDGVDDSQLTLKHLFIYATILSEKLHRTVTNKRLGVILPPGKLAAIANVACLLAGITPVNINYNATADEFRQLVEASGMNRFITEARFIHKQQQFPWPAQRDLIYIDRELVETGNTSFHLHSFNLWLDKTFTRMRHKHIAQPDAEALLLFSSATGGDMKGVSLTHRQLLAAIMQMCSRMPLPLGSRVLGVLPYHYPLGLLCGLLQPLLCGADIVTYPDTQSSKRLCELIHNYGTIQTVLTVPQTHALLRTGRPKHFASLRYFLITGGKLPTDMAQRALNEHKLQLRECYTLTELAAPAAICAPAPAPAPGTPFILPAGYLGCVGAAMPGTAIRVADLNNPDKVVPFDALGLIWLKGTTVIQAYLNDNPSAATCMHNGWFCTGDIGKMDSHGLLTLCGRKARFSKINEELVPHVAVEEALYRVLGIDQTDGQRRLAIVGVPNPRGGGEMLVMLSTVHKTVLPQDLITVRYALLNARYPREWAPDRIFPVNTIPVLPNGRLDYPVCYRGVCSQLGVPPGMQLLS